MFKKVVIVLIVLLGISLLAGSLYASLNENPESGKPSLPVSTSDNVITLERTACYGTCPIYTIMIHGDGRIVYIGEEHVEAEGERTAEISPELVQELVAFIIDGGYWELEDEYINRVMTDMPSTITSLILNGETKRIDHYFGDDNAPLILHQIENRIDLLANSAQWTGQDPAEDSKGVVYGRIIVRGSEGEVELPKGVVITARLEDVSLLDMPSILIAETTYFDLTQLPEMYSIAYDINALDANAMYNVSVDATSADGELVYWTDTAYNVLTFGAGGYADIELVPVNPIAVSGSIVIRGTEGVTELPAEVKVTVCLEDVSMADAPSVVLNEATYTVSQLPIFYSLLYDADTIDVTAEYAVSAEVHDAGGNLLYVNETINPVLTMGTGETAVIEIVAIK